MIHAIAPAKTAKVTVGPTFALQLGGGTGVLLGPEVALHLLPTRSPRSPMIQIFGRYDVNLRRRDVRDDVLSFGVRVLFDII
mgnify:CR=1 FL=1